MINISYLLIILLIVIYGVLPLNPGFHVTLNYLSWFMAIYLIAAYIRFYGIFPKLSHKSWGWISLLLIFMGGTSVIMMEGLYKMGYTSYFLPYFFIHDSNKLFAILIAISSFMYFKDLKIPHSKLINILGGATFGVLLIHANSNAMRQWLWKETVDCVGHFTPSVLWTVGYAVITVLIVFIVCAGIEWFRSRYIEPHILRVAEKFCIKCKDYIVAKFSNK